MRISLLSIFLICFLTVLTFDSNLYAQDQKFFSVKGDKILDGGGNEILLKGIGIGNWLVPEGYMFGFRKTNSPRLIDEMLRQLIGPAETNKFWKKFRDNYITQADVNFLKHTGFNSIRVPFNFRLFVSEENPDLFINTGFEALDRIIGYCEKAGLPLILDMHCAPGGQTGDNIDDSYGYPGLFVDRESQLLAIKIWKDIADRYSAKKIIIGYDLLNEPIATYFDAKTLNPRLEPFYKELVAEIRKVDQNHIVFIGGAQWNTNFDIFGPPFDSKSVYAFHKYWCDLTIDQIQSYNDYSKKYNVPVWMGESGENTDEWITSFRKMQEDNNIGWAFWPFKKINSTRGVVSINVPEGWDRIVGFAEADRSTYDEIRKVQIDRTEAINILNGFLENSKFEHCVINHDYLKALGLESTNK